MIKEALGYLVGLGATKELVDGNGDTWTDKQMHRIKEYLPAVGEAVVVHSLASMVEYIKSQPDKVDFPLPPSIVLIKNPLEVVLMNRLDEDGGRDVFVKAICDEPMFPFGRFVEVEPFILSMHGHFLPAGDGNTFQQVVEIVSALTAQDENAIKDTGLTQVVTTRKGIDIKPESIPNPMLLYPYRTFPDIDPVASPFLLRVKASNNVPQVALFETDGGRWKLESRRRIKQYLVNALGDAVFEQKLTIME
jgi:hypothetical protein